MSPDNSIKRVGILFSGGPAPAANAVISAAALAFINAGISVVGFYDGFENLEQFSAQRPLVEGRDFVRFTRDDVSGIRNANAIVLRTARANPGKAVVSFDDLADAEKNARLRAVFGAFEQLEVDALITIGGDDTLKTANYLFRIQEVVPGLRSVRFVHLPKTIDNDYNGIDWTFGFMTAADFAAKEILNIGADAKSTSAWYVLEVMGRKAGWLTYAAGIAGEATKMISVEDFDEVFDVEIAAEEVARLMAARAADGRAYGVVCVAEGLADMLPESQRPQTVDEHGNTVLAGAQIGRTFAEAIGRKFTELTGKKATLRHKQIGYEARCADPNAFDVVLGTQLGVGACRALVAEGLTGVMVSVEGQFQLTYVPFAELIDPETLKTVVRFIQRDSDFYRLARALEYQ
ncbi:MAG: 6-phosphofructokinase [Coriobacteriia bacterium]